MSPSPILFRRFVRTYKNDPLEDQVGLQEANSTYAHVRYLEGWESTVSLRDLAPAPAQPPPIWPQGISQTDISYESGCFTDYWDI